MPPAARKKILIIDDDADIREALVDILEAEGFDLKLASNGEQGLSTLKDDPEFDLIILDVMMPVMNGQEFSAQLQLIPSCRDIPVLVMSAGEHSDEHIQSLGAICYLRKPLDLAILIREVRRCIRQ